MSQKRPFITETFTIEKKCYNEEETVKKIRKLRKGGDNMLNKVMNNLAKHFASLALIVGVISTSQSCHFFLNQPEVPDEMKKLVKKRK